MSFPSSVEIPGPSPALRFSILHEAESAARAAHLTTALIKPLIKDNSPQAKLKRRHLFYRAIYGEFAGTSLVFSVIFCTLASEFHLGWLSQYPALCTFCNNIIFSFMTVSVIFLFSSVSGCHLNCAVTFATWMTGKTSNRKLIAFTAAQLAGSLFSTIIVLLLFPDGLALVDQLAVSPPLNLSKPLNCLRVLLMEFFLSFLLLYAAFITAYEDSEEEKKRHMNFQTVASSRGLTLFATTPQSKNGFSPFVIGFLLAALPLMGSGVSGGAINPVRLFGPAIVSGRWDSFYLYWFGQFAGGAVGALVVHKFHGLGSAGETGNSEDSSAASILARAQETLRRLDLSSPSAVVRPDGLEPPHVEGTENRRATAVEPSWDIPTLMSASVPRQEHRHLRELSMIINELRGASLRRSSASSIS